MTNNIDNLFSTFQSTVKGTGLKANKRLVAGQLIIDECLLVAVLDPEHLSSHCSFCFQEETVSKCSLCHLPAYCSKECQRNDWSTHKQECNGFKKIYPNKPTTYMRLVGRLLIMQSDALYVLLIL